ncbi:DNA-binding NarL/FixJ family response regulator [Novosphingobium chloroacetimidivorans]|uniref:DNA-binding NarL/FixJ family response regulator n=1 Tax=Novosphingobium chloroacetimidivorans TaxID=1428314 RepID=A0A7W7KB62_9SPHN|nr:response regulator transcription factor [Novosphingobium chloroacetimidivorans]MBB4859589.1 DNA-binding NarL/FixJ family response regulator [Novosphingobium chloroacetimidivorans]
MDTRRILIADDHPLAREGLALAVRHAIPGAVISGVGTIAQAEALVARGRRFDLALLDLMLPDTHGFSGLLQLQFALPQVPVVIVTAREEPALARTARELGAAGFLRKSAPLDNLAEALRGIVAGKPVFSAGRICGDAGLVRERMAKLSPARRRVLFALADGRANKQIAQDLDVSEATVKAHLTAIFRLLGVHNRMQAMLALQPLLGETAQ